ncbi:hypothetical protein F4778DRAFT_788009 [Xylariomycetidae sp. FL2044]|nr:hypothetical protein F4778DRAFT_788009 [Xylariomycetidae sp. FL2044]
MASNPYEVEHNISAAKDRPHRRRPDMSSFTSHLHQISTDDDNDNDDNATPSHHNHHHAHAGPTPVDLAALFRLVQDQFATLALDAPTDANRRFLEELATALERDIGAPPDRVPGVSQEYLDALDRVARKALKRDDTCPICAEPHLDDPYCLVVELPCPGRHRYDLECVGPWLQSKGTCPMCRADLTKKKTVVVPKAEDGDEEEEEDVDGLYG